MITRSTAIITLAFGCNALFAAELVLPETHSRWHVEAGPSWWQGSSLSQGALESGVPSTAAKTDRFYEDGYNRVDASGNVGDGSAGPLASRTGYFGYLTAGQVNLAAGTLSLHQVRAQAGAYSTSGSLSRDPGFDVAIRRSLASEQATYDWGIEIGADFTSATQKSSGAISVNMRVLTDTYALGGVVPQPAPYSGRFSPLPGDQRIGDTPTRAITSATGTVTGTRSFEERTTLFRLGAWTELLAATRQPPQSESDHWSVLVRGGPAFISTRASFALNEQVQLAGFSAPSPNSASDAKEKNDLSWFLGARVRRTFNENWALVGWGDFVHGSLLSLSNADRYYNFDATRSVLLGIALEYAK